MKFADLVARLAFGLGQEVGDFAESFRVMRLGIPDADDGRAFAWAGGVTLKTLFRGRTGPGRGAPVNAATVSFLLTALMADAPRRALAEEAMNIQFARAPLTLRGKQMICPKTSESFFGGALAKCLSDRVLFDDLVQVSVSTQFGSAQLLFKSDVDEWNATHIAGKSSPIFMSERARIDPHTLGLQRTAILKLDTVRFLFDAINEPERKRVVAGVTARP